MSISTTTFLNVRPGGNDNNGGGFNAAGGSPGTNYSLQDAAQVFVDGSAISAVVHSTTTQVTITGYAVAAADNRNLFQITGGTATAGTYEITAVDTVNNRWTLDRSAGTAAQTVVGRMGGARLTVGSAVTSHVGGNRIYFQKGVSAYTPSASLVLLAGVSAVTPTILEGYETTQGDLSANKPVLQATGAIANGVVDNGSAIFIIMRNFEIDCNSKSGVRGIRSSGNHTMSRFVKVTASNASGIEHGGQGAVINCEVVGGSGGGVAGQYIFDNYIHDRTGGGILGLTPGGTIEGNVVANCTGATTDGISASGIYTVRNNTVYNSGRHGINVIGGNCALYIGNNLCDTCGGYGIATDAVRLSYIAFNNAFRACTSGTFDATQLTATGTVTLTTSPFVSTSTPDFSLNSTSGGGLACRGTGYSTFPGLSSTNYRDIGAVQSRGGGVIRVGMSGGFER